MANYIDRINAGLNVVLRRQSGAPLDVSEVFLSLADFEAYVLQNTAYNNTAYSAEENAFLNQINPYSYAGQVVGVVENGVAKAYIINKVGALEEGENLQDRYNAVGTEVTVDNKTLANVGGVLMLANIPNERTKVMQPVLQVDGTLAWTEISETTVEGLSGLISALTTRVDGIDTRVAAVEAAYIKNVEYAEGTGVFTFTKQDGTTFTVDLAVEKVVTNFVYDEGEKALILTYADGTTQNVPMSAFIDVYTGVDGATIKVEVGADNTIAAEVKDGTIGAVKLAEAVNADIAKGVDAQGRVATVEGQVTELVADVAALEGAGYITADQAGALADGTTIKYTDGKLGVGTIAGTQVSGKVAEATKADEASKVTAGLIIGNETYDGSAVKEVTPEAIGAAKPEDIHTIIVKANGEAVATNAEADAEVDFVAGSDNVTVSAEEGKITITVEKPVFTDTNRAINVNGNELLGAANKTALDFKDTETVALDVATGAIKANVVDGSISETKLADGAVTEAKIAAAAVTNGKIAAGAVNTVQIAANAVTEAKVADSAITEAKIAANAVTEAKIADNAVSTAKVADGAITDAKIDTVNAAKLFQETGDVLVLDCGNAD